MKIQKTELAQKINKIKSVVQKETPMAANQGILVKDGYFTANSWEMAVKSKAEDADGECFIIPMKAFGLIEKLPDGEVEITSDGDSITITAENIRNKYQTMDPGQFPEVPMPEGEEQEIIVDAAELLKSMKRVSCAIAKKKPNQPLGAMLLHAHGGYLNFVGTDGHVMAWDKVDYYGEFSLLIPKSAVEKLQGLELRGSVSIRHNRLGALFVTDGYEVYTRLIEGEYFQYQRMFNELPLHTAVAREDLLNAMVRANMCTDERSAVRFEISGSALNISTRDQTADYHETVYLREPLAQDLAIGFDARLVIETLKAFDCENVRVQLAAEKMPMIIEAEDSDFKSIVLPVMLR